MSRPGQRKKSQRKNAETLAAEASAALQAGHRSKAEKLYRLALKDNPKHAPTLSGLGQLALADGDAEKAAKHFADAVRSDETLVGAWIGLASGLLGMNDRKQAVQACQKALDLDPENTAAHFQLANIASREGHVDTAIEHFEHCLRKKKDPQVMDRTARLHFLRGDSRTAIELWREGIALAPKDANLWTHLANGLMESGALEESEKAYRKALELHPELSQAHVNLGNLLRRTGRIADAVGLYEKARELSADSPEPLACLGLAAQESGDVAAAVRLYRDALKLDPQHGGARNNLNLAIKYNGDPDLAVRRARRQAERTPGQRRTELALAKALWEAGHSEESGEILGRLAETESGSGIRYWRGLAAFSNGQLGEAQQHLAAAVELKPDDLYAMAARDSAMQGAGDGPRIALHMNQRYHYHILRPVFDAAAGKAPLLLTPHVHQMVEFEPDLVVVAESHGSVLRPRFPNARVVHVRHGFASKNTAIFSARSSDYVCVSSEGIRDWYLEKGSHPRGDFWVTGYVQMDPLFQGTVDTSALPIPADRKCILYAPTWNAELSSAPMLGSRIRELLVGERDDVVLVIKPHPVTQAHHPQWLRDWQELAERHPDMHLVSSISENIMPWLARADALVTDASSVMFEFLATDRPVVLISNPRRYGSTHYDPTGIEWTWRDLGDDVEDVDDLPGILARALDEPGHGAKKRAAWREKLFGSCTDGRAAERIVEQMLNL